MESVVRQSRPQAVPPTGEAAATAGPKKRRPFLIMGVVALAVLLGLGALMLYNRGKESTDDAQVEADVVPIAPRVSGMVKHLAVVENQHVKKGDTCADRAALAIFA